LCVFLTRSIVNFHALISLFKLQHTFQRPNIAYLCRKCYQTRISQSIDHWLDVQYPVTMKPRSPERFVK